MRVDEKYKRQLDYNIEALNLCIKMLEDIGIYLKDSNNPDYALDYIYYSTATDNYIARFKEVKE